MQQGLHNLTELQFPLGYWRMTPDNNVAENVNTRDDGETIHFTKVFMKCIILSVYRDKKQSKSVCSRGAWDLGTWFSGYPCVLLWWSAAANLLCISACKKQPGGRAFLQRKVGVCILRLKPCTLVAHKQSIYPLA